MVRVAGWRRLRLKEGEKGGSGVEGGKDEDKKLKKGKKKKREEKKKKKKIVPCRSLSTTTSATDLPPPLSIDPSEAEVDETGTVVTVFVCFSDPDTSSTTTATATDDTAENTNGDNEQRSKINNSSSMKSSSQPQNEIRCFQEMRRKTSSAANRERVLVECCLPFSMGDGDVYRGGGGEVGGGTESSTIKLVKSPSSSKREVTQTAAAAGYGRGRQRCGVGATFSARRSSPAPRRRDRVNQRDCCRCGRSGSAGVRRPRVHDRCRLRAVRADR